MKSKTTTYFLLAFFCSFTFLSITSFSIGAQGDLKTSQSHIFDGLYANYTGTGMVSSNSSFTYSYDSGTLYNVTWWEQGGGTASWLEDTETRLTSNATGGFGSGVHTPVWIFTNLTVGNGTTIVVDGGFEHPYNVTDEIAVNYPGFGNMDVLVLEDEWYFTLAWYEKTTGLLINGTFQWFGGGYTFALTETNMFGSDGGGGIPGFEIFLVLPQIGIISLFLVKRRRKNLKIKS